MRDAPPDGRPGGLLAYFVGHRTAANLLLLLMVVSGLIAATQLRAQFFPDVVVESVTVTTTWSGAAPEEMDTAVVERLEPALRALEGVEEVTATAREGVASIFLEFAPGWDMTAAVDEVKAAVDGVTDLPDDADDPAVRRGRFWDPVTDVVISGPVSVELLDRYARDLRTRLFQAGVTRAEIEGVSTPRVVIEPRPEALERHGLTLDEIARAVAAETGTTPVGDIAGGGARVRTGAEDRHSAEAVAAVAVRALPDGTKVRVGDIASVREEGLTSEVALYSGGHPAVVLDVDRGAGDDAIATLDTVKRVIAEVAPTLPEGVTVVLYQTTAAAITERLDILLENGLTGLAIVLVLLFLFLSSRTAFWVAVGIPAAMLATLALMLLFGLTLNMLSLFALIICLGIVVDDAIVVGEHADHLARHGTPPALAATTAARRMAAPVIAASLTTVIAFGSMVLIGGRMGDMITDLPVTVAAVVLASLVESFFVLPAHMRHALAHRAEDRWIDRPSKWVDARFRAFRERAFRPFVAFSVRFRHPVLAGTVLLLAVTVAAVVDRTVPWTFWSAPERGTITANVAMLPGATRADTLAQLAEMDAALARVNARFAAEHGTPPVEMTLSKVGGVSGHGVAGSETKDPDQLGSLSLELIDPDARPYSAFEVVEAWQAEIVRLPLLETLSLRGERAGPGGVAIDVRLTGGDPDTLKAASEEIKAALAEMPGVSGLDDSQPYDKPEYLLALTPKGEAIGFTTDEVAAQLSRRLDGAEATSFARDGREIEIDVRLPEAVTGPGYLHAATLRVPGGGGFVPLTDIVTITETQGYAAIRRVDGEVVLTVTGAVSEDARVREAVQEALSERILPVVAARHGVGWALGGLAEQEREFLSDALVGFVLGVIGIYLTLAWIFGSWVRPLIIVAVIPFGLVGAVWGHWLHGVPLTMFSVVGLIGMAGIVINDSIVLITTIDQKSRTRARFHAIVDGAADRLRAVMLTTLTTVGGLAPMLFEDSRQAQFLKPTVITLAYGLGFGMVLVLIVTPALLMVQHDVHSRLHAARRFARHLTGRRRRGLGRPAKG